MLSRCEHREGHTDGRICPLRKVRTRGTVGGHGGNWLFDIISREAGRCVLTAGKISVVYNRLSGMRGWDGAYVALRNAELDDMATKKLHFACFVCRADRCREILCAVSDTSWRDGHDAVT